MRSSQIRFESHFVLEPEGPERIGPDGLSRWADFVDTPVRHTAVWWERVELGPAARSGTGEILEPSRVFWLPVALRLDFDSGHVWLVAAEPKLPSAKDAYIGNDEIMVVFSAETMRDMGFTDLTFAPEDP